MTILTAKSLKKDFGIKEILKDASFSIEEQDKVGLIGVNGSGKSTLLKILGGIEVADSGDITSKSGARIIYLPQQPDIEPENNVLQQVFAYCGQQMQLIGRYEEISHQMASDESENQQALMKELASVAEEIERQNAWDLETNAKIILDKLGIKDFDSKMGNLSGGYRKRVALAAALMAEPDLLLMDEPTNHLDAESVQWLQEYLQKYSGAILLITHDRYFLDQVTNRILEIDRADMYAYSGNYSYFLEKKALAEDSIASTQQKHKGVLRRELEWLKRGPKARSTKQKARIQRIDEMKNREFKTAQGKVEVDTISRRIGKKVIEFHNVTKGYEGRTLVKDFSYEFMPSQRVGIIGGNGAGKSTLMNLVMGETTPDEGHIELGSTIQIGYFDQYSENLITAKESQMRVMEYIKEVASYVDTSDGKQISASQLLERFLFTPNQQYSPIEKLSGGEKRRLFLLRILISNPNVLILDEPTNDLDVQTLSVLEEYIESFAGCVIVVSHDRYFLDRTVDTIFALDGQGGIKQYPGNYSVYLDYKKHEEYEAKQIELAQKEKENKATNKNTKKEKSNYKKNRSTAKRLSNYQQRELTKLENEIIPALEEKKADLESKIYGANVDYEKLNELTEELNNLTLELDEKTEKWLELSELAEQ